MPVSVPVAAAAAAAPTSRPVARRYVVDLGAFADAGGMEGARRRAARRVDEVARFAPASASFTIRPAGDAYMLSMAGFGTREAAAGLCRRIRAAPGACAVREAAGDALAARASPSVRLALR